MTHYQRLCWKVKSSHSRNIFSLRNSEQWTVHRRISPEPTTCHLASDLTRNNLMVTCFLQCLDITYIYGVLTWYRYEILDISYTINSFLFHSVCIHWQLFILIASACNNLTPLAFPFLRPGFRQETNRPVEFPTLKSNYLQPSTFNQIIFYQIYKRNFSTEIDCEGCKYFNLIFSKFPPK